MTLSITTMNHSAPTPTPTPTPTNAETKPNRGRLEQAPSAVADTGKPAPPADEVKQPASLLTSNATQEQAKPDTEAIGQAVKQVRQQAQNLQYTNLEFSVDEQYGETVIKISDSETKELIRQIPPEYLVALAGRLKELEESKGSHQELGALVNRGLLKGGATTEGQGLLLSTKA